MTSKLVRIRELYKQGLMNKEVYIKKMHHIHAVLWDYLDFIQNENVESLTISRENIILTTHDGIKMVCDREDERIIPIEILNFGGYETAEIRMIRHFLDEDSVIIDIGANIGWYSLNLSRDVTKGRIIAFEPIPKSYNYLRENLRLNNIGNVEIYNLGFSDKDGMFEFYHDKKLSGSASLKNIRENRKTIKIKCEVKRFDDFIPKITSKIDLIKCDVEGAEIFVIRGAIETLKKTRPILFLEMLRKWSAKFGYHPNEIIDLLNNIGYKCYFVENEKLIGIDRIDNEIKATNFYFLNSNKHIKYLKELS